MMGVPTSSQTIHEIVKNNQPDLETYIKLYKHLHSHPELSHNEKQTAKTIAESLTAICPDIIVTSNIGGYGVVGVLENGNGPKVLLRAELDALPVKEMTGLDYASTTKMIDASLPSEHPESQTEKPVMHACGHDMHMTALLASAESLVKCRSLWSGTLILLFQPAEEKGDGARTMLADGVYDKIGHVPDVLLGGHVMPYRSGYIGTRKGLMASSADSLEITLFGKGGHSSTPHCLIDPVLMAAHCIVRLQSIVSREIDPSQQAVVTVASIHAGDAENVIPDTATVKVDVRTIDDKVRNKVMSAIKRIIKAECDASGATREPEFKTLRLYPILNNDGSVTTQLEGTFGEYFGTEKGLFKKYQSVAPRVSGSEDFGELATAIDRPACYWIYGGISVEMWDGLLRKGMLSQDTIPINHSDKFAPAIMPTLQVAIDSNIVAALTWLMRGN